MARIIARVKSSHPTGRYYVHQDWGAKIERYELEVEDPSDELRKRLERDPWIEVLELGDGSDLRPPGGAGSSSPGGEGGPGTGGGAPSDPPGEPQETARERRNRKARERRAAAKAAEAAKD